MKGKHDKALMEIIVDPIDEQLNRFERDIRQLKIEYEQYFGGGRKRPPAEIEWRLDTVLKRYGDRGAQMNYAQRFKFGNLSETYARYRDVLHKRLRKHEEGTVERHYGAAARALQAEQARSRRAQLQTLAIASANPAREPKNVDQLYEQFRTALESSGESTARLSREQFEQFVRQKTEQLRGQSGSQVVEFVVSIEGGKARLKARVT
jgi:hypothetical protein